MDIEALRRQIPTTRQAAYLNTGWAGPNPVSVVEAITAQLQAELEDGPASPATIARGKTLESDVRAALAAFLRVAPEEVIPTQNTTAGLNLVAGGLDWRPGDHVVTCSLEHPSVLGVCHGLGQRHGARVTVVQLQPQDETASILEKFAEAIEPGTRLLALSHVQYSCGLRVPVEELIPLAHQRGARVMLDGAQTVGQVDLDLHRLGVDYYSGPGQKWLLGPQGTGVLYVRADLIAELQPVAGSFRSVESVEERGDVAFRTGDLVKLLTGTDSPALLAGLKAALEFVSKVGTACTEARSRELGQQLKGRLSEAPGVTLTCPTDPARSSGLVTCAIEGQEPAQVVQRLWSEERIAARAVRHPSAVRFCTAFFNTEEEVDRAAAAVRRIARGS